MCGENMENMAKSHPKCCQFLTPLHDVNGAEIRSMVAGSVALIESRNTDISAYFNENKLLRSDRPSRC